jgi:muramoyltetrapeptide carboxypeptidase
MLGTALVGASCLSANSIDFKIPEASILPKRLMKGDTIGICAPAGPIRETREVDEFSQIIRDLGFKVKLGKNVTGKHGFFSASDEERADEFMSLIQDEEVNGIFVIRGGWGCARLLELLDFDLIKNNPKVILGFSDLTTFLNAISSRTGLITFHGPNGNSTWNDYSVKYIKELLVEGEQVKFRNNSSADQKIKTYSQGTAVGQLYGGNLSVLSGLTGSDYLPDWKGKILFLEDVNEEPYRIDRMLTQLKLAGIFDQVAGIILGGFRKCIAEEPDRSFTLEEVFDQHFKGLSIPIYQGAQIGHIRNKFTVPVGLDVKMDADQGTIELMSPAVS